MKPAAVRVFAGLMMMFAANGDVFGQRRGQQPSQPGLTQKGEALLAQYTAMLQGLRAEIVASVPAIDETLLTDLQAADRAAGEAQAEVNRAAQPLNAIRSAEGLVGHARNKWIREADQNIARSRQALENAKTDDEREQARKELERWQKNRADGEQALKDRLAALERARANEAADRDAHAAARKVLSEAIAAQDNARQALVRTIVPFLASDARDHALMKIAVLAAEGPANLAAFAQQGKEQETYVVNLLNNKDLLHAMLTNGGAAGGKYLQARQILDRILAASTHAAAGTPRHLALAVSLEFADAPDRDALKRYLAYEKAFLDGELDPAFPQLTPWDMRMVVNGDEPEEISAWGRAMLRNYRPDHVMAPNHGWRYSGIVRTDVRYGSQNVRYDRPELHRYQNIIMNGGVCGRRAFFGRFILRSFGIPTIARPSRGHAALGRWTPDGWVVNLGGGWGAGWTAPGRTPDTVFLQTTRIRRLWPEYLQMLRAEWVATALRLQPNADNAKADLWTRLADYRAKLSIAESKPAELAALGEEIGEANEAEEVRAAAVAAATVTERDRQISIGSDGVITIPAGAFRGAQLVMSFLGGQQMIHSRGISCEVEVPRAGRYALTARIVTVGQDQTIEVTTNDKDPLTIDIPYTLGLWETTQPVEIALVQGKNKLSFSGPSSRAFALKDFTLTPVR